MPTIRLPNDWRPRPYQRPLWSWLERGGRRAFVVWHRRAGKDEICLHWAAVAAHQRVGGYWHMLPQAAQARKAVWDAVNPHTGRRRIDEAFPKVLRATTREAEMMIRLKCGSTWQVVGSDNYDRLVGAPPAGVVFSEWALADPDAWAYIRPILAENGGWAVFITTPRGDNHAARLFHAAKTNSDWFAEVLPATSTEVFTPEQLAVERQDYVRDYGESDGETRFQQEYLCRFEAAIVGAYYAQELATARADGRIADVPVDPVAGVITAWDLGISDATAIWFAQSCGSQVRLIDYLENASVGLDWYAKALAGRGYRYILHLLPHDARVRELGSGRTRLETLQALGVAPVRAVARHPLADGINAVRRLLARTHIEQNRCRLGLEALAAYRRVWDRRLRSFEDAPLHDWASHGADALRTLAVGLPATDGQQQTRPLVYRDGGYV